jgi:hypothetical protein
MATQKQTKANRTNAQKSTGPKTAEGKATVSQNAVKHGLFAQSVIYGENEGDYEAFHEKFFAKLDPVGAVELFLAERAANLAWRLKRAERMQNQVIEDMIGRLVTTNPARRRREDYYYNQGRRPDEPGVDLDELPLGRIANSDWSCNRVLDRMLMYERRIENSFHKTMHELERQKLIRQVEQQYEPEQAIHFPIKDNRDVAATRNLSAEKKVDLKKQSQFVPGLMGATSYVKEDYDIKPAAGDNENKAKQSQLDAPFSPEGIGARENSPTIAAG